MVLTWRNLRKNKIYALINLLGLTLGLSISAFIFLFVLDESSYDKYLDGYDKVIRIQPEASDGDETQQWATTEGFLIPTLAPMYPGIEANTRLLRVDNEIIFRTETEVYSQDGIIAADSTFFEVFPFRLIHGDRRTALQGGIVITQEVSKKFFGNENPIGKILTADFGPVTVNGVVEDIPEQSHFHFKVMFPLRMWWRDSEQSRNAYAFYSYLRFRTPELAHSFGEDVLRNWYSKHGYPDGEKEDSRSRIVLHSMPLTEIHLQSHAEKEFEANGQLQVVYIFIAAGILLMLIATINYINLSNAIAIRRAKEVAIRKTIGASRGRLFLGFIIESYGFTLLAFVIAFAAAVALLPQFNLFSGKQFDISIFSKPEFLAAAAIAWLVLGFLAGFYPATILASFDPVQALKSGTGSSKANKFSGFLRHGLLISQFTISSLLIVGTFAIQSQLNFIETRNIGFNKNNVVVIKLPREARRQVSILKNELGRLEHVTSSSVTSAVPGKRVTILIARIPDLAGTRSTPEGEDDGTREIRTLGVDHDFVKTLGLEIVDGRDLNDSRSDSAEAFILNEAAVNYFQLKDPVGRPFEFTYGEFPKKGKVVGVVKDFNFASVHSTVEPVMMHVYPQTFSTLCIRLNTADTKTALEEIEATWKKVTAVPFSYQFLDKTYDALYRTEQTTGKVISLFTALALFIAGMGLFGIVSIFVSRRTREVGIRKVFGASHSSLIRVLSRDYLIMVVIGNLIAIYPSYYLVSQWLQRFAYHIDLSFSGFVAAFLLSELLAFGSIVFVVLKAARSNPVDSLRHE